MGNYVFISFMTTDKNVVNIVWIGNMQLTLPKIAKIVGNWENEDDCLSERIQNFNAA